MPGPRNASIRTQGHLTEHLMGMYGTLDLGRRWDGENAQIWMEPFTLASQHPLVAELHQ